MSDTATTTTNETPGLLSRERAAAWLGVNPRTLDRLTARGDLAAVRIGRRPLYRLETLDAYARSAERRLGA